MRTAAVLALGMSLASALPASDLSARFTDPLRVTKHFTITSPIDPSIDPKRVIAALNDQTSLARMSPYVFDVQGPVQPSSDDSAAISSYVSGRANTDFPSSPATINGSPAPWNTWAIKETVPLYGEVDFHGNFQSMKDGLDTIVLAPAQVTFVTQWRVLTGGLNTLSEDFNVTCDALMMPFITGNIHNAHTQIQAKILQGVQNGSLPASNSTRSS